MSDLKKGPDLEDIIKKNWKLDEFISEGYLEGSSLYLGNKITSGRKIPQLILKGDDVKILKTWAREIDPEIEKIYSRQGWNFFKKDLLLVHSNPGRLFLSGQRYSCWYRNGDNFVSIIAEEKLNIYITPRFEDVFFNTVSDTTLEIINPSEIEKPYSDSFDLIYSDRSEDVETILQNLEEGKIIEIKGFPIEMNISPLTEMTYGLFFMNNNYEFVLIGEIIDKNGIKKTRSEVYNYVDGQRIASSLALDENKWFYAIIR